MGTRAQCLPNRVPRNGERWFGGACRTGVNTVNIFGRLALVFAGALVIGGCLEVHQLKMELAKGVDL